MAATDQGAFVLGVRVEGVAQVLGDLKRLEAAADAVSSRLSKLGNRQDRAFQAANFKEFEKSFKAIERANTALTNASKNQKKLIRELIAEYNRAVRETNKLGSSMRDAMRTGEIAVKGTTNAVGSFNDSMEGAIARIIKYRVAFGVWQGLVNLVTQMVDTTKELDQTIVDLQKVMNSVGTDFQFLTQVAFDLGRRFSTSAIEVADSMRVWAQQGNDQVAVAKLVEATLLGVNSANLTATEATEALTAATKSFNVEAENAPQLVDKWLAVQANFAVTAQDLANAIKTVGAAAQVAGVDLDQLNGIVAAIGSVTRKTGREVANSFKTMLARINRLPTIKTFQDLGIAVRKSQDELRAIPDVLEDLADIWPTLTSAQQQNIAISVAGIRRYSDFAVLMQNFGEFTEATAVSFNALGQAQLAQQTQLTSFNSQLERIVVAFQEVGFEIANSGLLQFGVDLASSFGDIVLSLKPFAPAISGAVVGLTSFGAVAGSIGAVLITFRGLTTLLFNTLGKLSVGALTTGASVTTLKDSFLAANTAGKLFGATLRTIGLAAGTLVAAFVAFEVISAILSTFNNETERTKRSIQELNDIQRAQVVSNENVLTTNRESVKSLRELSDARNRFASAAGDNLSATEKEVKVQQQLLDAYGDTINKFPELIKEVKEGAVEYDLSSNAIAKALERAESATDDSRRTLVESARQTREGFLQQLDQLASGIEARRNLLSRLTEGGLLDNVEILTPQSITIQQGSSSIRTTVNALNPLFEDLATQVKQLGENSGISEALQETINEQVDQALANLNTSGNAASQQKAVQELATVLRESLGKAQTEAASSAGALQVEIDKLSAKIADSTIVARENVDAYFFIEQQYSGLVKQLTRLRAEQSLFERDNRSLAGIFDDLNLRFDATGRAVTFYRNQLQSIFDIRRNQEVKIAIQEQVVELAKASNVTETTIKREEEKLEVLKRQTEAVSGGFQAFKRQQEVILETSNSTIASLQEQLNAEIKIKEELIRKASTVENRKDAEEGINAAIKDQDKKIKEINTQIRETQRLTQENVTANIEAFKQTVEQGSAYADLINLASIYVQLLDNATQAHIAHKDAVGAARLNFQQLVDQGEFAVALLRERENGQRRVLETEKENNRLQIEFLRNEEKRRDASIDEEDAAERVRRLKQRQLEIDKQLALNAASLDISTLIGNVTQELNKQQAITDILIAQTGNLAGAEFDRLQIERERTIAEFQALEAKRKSLNVQQDEEQLLARRQQLTQDLFNIEVGLFAQRLRVFQEFRAQVDQVSQEIGTGISGGLAGIQGTQVDRFNELKTIAQELANLEAERQQALDSGNDESLFEAEQAIADLRDRQQELNSATFIWKETLGDIAKNISDIVNNKLAERFTEGLLELSAGESSLGDLLAKGVVFIPDEVKFAETEQSLNDAFTKAIEEASRTGATLMGEEIRSALSGAGTGAGSTGGLLSDEGSNTLRDAANTVEGINNEIETAGKKTAGYIENGINNAADVAAAKWKSALAAGAQLLANVIATQVFGGGQGASTGSALGGTLGALTPLGPLGGVLGSFLGAGIGSLFDDDSIEEPNLNNFSDSNPLPVSVEEINEPQTILHDVSVAVEANFLDPTQLDPVAMRNLAIHVRQETEDLLRRENIWGG